MWWNVLQPILTQETEAFCHITTPWRTSSMLNSVLPSSRPTAMSLCICHCRTLTETEFWSIWIGTIGSHSLVLAPFFTVPSWIRLAEKARELPASISLQLVWICLRTPPRGWTLPAWRKLPAWNSGWKTTEKPLDIKTKQGTFKYLCEAWSIISTYHFCQGTPQKAPRWMLKGCHWREWFIELSRELTEEMSSIAFSRKWRQKSSPPSMWWMFHGPLRNW